jgi:3-isopropylmalate/(R)-2-methylmalate dehydratase large subunit
MSAARHTLYDKLWNAHVIEERDDGACLIYIDRHLVHEVTSPQAFESLRLASRTVRRPSLTLAMPDHNVPTSARPLPADTLQPDSARQIDALASNCLQFDIPYIDMADPRHGIVHVVGPEQGLVLPGLTVVCGDSHTASHGALGALAFGIGTTQVEHVLATQTLVQRKSKAMQVHLTGALAPSVSAKDLALYIVGHLGPDGGNGHVIEYSGEAVQQLSVEARLTLCNMAIEAGARSALIAPDETTFAYLKGRPLAPTEAQWDAALVQWRTLSSDPGAHFDAHIEIDASQIRPMVTWGTSPADVVPIDGVVPTPANVREPARRRALQASLDYMGLEAGMKMTDIQIDVAFLGSCTNARIEDLREAARVLADAHVSAKLQRAFVVPGSGLVKRQAEAEGLDQVFRAAGFEWREPGCSACLGMNEDRILPGQRCASTSNRNFPGRQGPGARTHLMSPAMVAASALAGHICDPRNYLP